MSAQHTPEQWEVLTDIDGDIYIQTAKPLDISISDQRPRWRMPCKVSIAKIFPHDNNNKFSGKENARRIVACVNACAGIDTTLLESFAKGYPTPWDMVRTANDERDQLNARVAELEARNAEQFAALLKARERLSEIDTAMDYDVDMALEAWRHSCSELDEIIANQSDKGAA